MIFDIIELRVLLFEVAFDIFVGNFLPVDSALAAGILFKEEDKKQQPSNRTHSKDIGYNSVESGIDGVRADSVSVGLVDKRLMLVFVIIGVIINEILDWEGGVLLEMDPWIWGVGIFQLVMIINDTFDTGEVSVGFVLDPGGIFINVNWVIMMIMVIGTKVKFKAWAGEESAEREWTGDDFAQHKDKFCLTFILIFMVIWFLEWKWNLAEWMVNSFGL